LLSADLPRAVRAGAGLQDHFARKPSLTQTLRISLWDGVSSLRSAGTRAGTSRIAVPLT